MMEWEGAMGPYYIKLIRGDSSREMQKLPDNCIDLTVTSPPYDNMRRYRGSIGQYGEHVWMMVLAELQRITKPGGVIVWVVGDQTIKGNETKTAFKQALWAEKCGLNLHDTMIYAKKTYMPLNHNRYEQASEYMFAFSKGAPKTFHPILVPCVNLGRKINRGHGKTLDPGYADRRREEITVTKEKKIHPNIFYYAPITIKKSIHTAPFPEALVNDQILSWSNEGDTIFDPFMGSGTTGKMAKALSRNFIGIEINEEYFAEAKDRINRAYCPFFGV